MKDSAWMKDLYSRTYTTRFFSDNWRLVTKVREGQIDVNPMNDLLCWRLTLQKYFGHDKSWWEASHDIGSFYKNVRYYLRDKVADQIIRENKVYTISRNLNYIMSVGSKFDVRWRRERILAGTPLFFIEKDYAGRMIFMAGTQTFALSIAQALSVRELKEEKE
jgi:hypothetical protein